MDDDARLRSLAARVRTADVVDAMGRFHRHRCHLTDLRSPTPERQLFGPAVTISYLPSCRQNMPTDQYNFADLFSEAIRDKGPGHVLVLASNGYPDTSLCGKAKLSLVGAHGLAGILADGRLRDFAELAEFDFAAYCRGEAVRWGGDVVTPFEANRPVTVSGVLVRPGDYVFADAAGAAVIPAPEVLAVLEEAVNVVNEEDSFVEMNLPTRNDGEPRSRPGEQAAR
ncbi:RraA family protein [Streptomyces fructofermentans]|uniref:RraA family protein n=1 Tax=Streptomyces fructofermentans TaxID=152141 RepID=UPI0033F1B64F